MIIEIIVGGVSGESGNIDLGVSFGTHYLKIKKIIINLGLVCSCLFNFCLNLNLIKKKKIKKQIFY